MSTDSNSVSPDSLAGRQAFHLVPILELLSVLTTILGKTFQPSPNQFLYFYFLSKLVEAALRSELSAHRPVIIRFQGPLPCCEIGRFSVHYLGQWALPCGTLVPWPIGRSGVWSGVSPVFLSVTKIVDFRKFTRGFLQKVLGIDNTRKKAPRGFPRGLRRCWLVRLCSHHLQVQ